MDPQVKAHRGLLGLLLLSITFLKVDAGNDTLQVPDNVNCACPGEVLTFTCNIAGGGTTLWRGSAFDCSSTSNEIRLRHSTFASSGTMGTCNNEAMRARSIGLTNGDCYTSELSVTVSTTFNDETIECAYNSGTDERAIGVSTLMVAAPEVHDIRIMDLRNGEITLNWTTIPTCARPVFYNVTSNCSTCSPIAANSTTASCLLPQQWTDVLKCGFSVQSTICDGNLIEMSNAFVVTLQEPAVNIVPHYSEKDNTLIKVIVLGTDLGIAKSASGTIYVTQYNVTFLDTNAVIHAAPYMTCREDMCNDTDITPPSLSQICSSASSVTVNISSDYGFGQRQLSEPITIGCTNQLIDVQYNMADSTISCVLLNPTNTSIKSCRVTYGHCDQEQDQNVEGVSSADLPNNNIITVKVPRGSYCYTATASTDDFIVAVEGSIQTIGDTSEAATNVNAIVGGVVGGGLFILALIMVPIIVIIVLKLKGQKRKSNGALQILSIMPSIEAKLNLELITERNFERLDIRNDCKLRETIEYSKKKLKFVRGRAYYEFVHDKENISEDKQLIFMKDTGEFFYPNVALGVLYENKLLGEGVQRPEYKNYRVFVQSTGSGARHLPANSLLLYEKAQSNPWNPEKAPLQHVISDHFMTTTITSECTAKEFQTSLGLRVNGANVFIEFKHGNPIIEDIRDVILKDKKTGKLFTGPTARLNPTVYLDKYRVFILPRNTEKVKLESGKTILHQDPESRQNSKFKVLEVDEDNIQLAKFVEKKLSIKYENGRAFYEFIQMEEDLLFYRDVVMMPKSPEKQTGIEFKSSIVRFYWLSSSVPDKGIKPPSVDQYRVFVQSRSQGSRCLKARTSLLYKV